MNLWFGFFLCKKNRHPRSSPKRCKGSPRLRNFHPLKEKISFHIIIFPWDIFYTAWFSPWSFFFFSLQFVFITLVGAGIVHITVIFFEIHKALGWHQHALHDRSREGLRGRRGAVCTREGEQRRGRRNIRPGDEPEQHALGLPKPLYACNHAITAHLSAVSPSVQMSSPPNRFCICVKFWGWELNFFSEERRFFYCPPLQARRFLFVSSLHQR